MRNCELCKYPARMYCESDQASLCWDCDAKVHSANFLVARHSRCLLCHLCQSPTPWKASGEKLGPTVSICERCVDSSGEITDLDGEEEDESEEGNDDEIGSENDTDESDDGDEDDEDELEEVSVDDDEDEDEDGDNQVVPLSSRTATPTPPPCASSSSSEESSSMFSDAKRGFYQSKAVISLKRMRHAASDLRSQEDHDCLSSKRKYLETQTSVDSVATSVDSVKGLKYRRSEPGRTGQVNPLSAAVIRSDICSGKDDGTESNKEAKAVDLNCSDNLSRSI